MSSPLFDSLARIHLHDELGDLLDFVTRTVVASTDWSTALLTFYFGDTVYFGATGCPADIKERFRESYRRTSLEMREQKRQDILRFQRPGTNVCFIPAGRGPRPASAYIPSAEGPGSWAPDDRLIVVLRDWEDRILGLLSLDNPRSGDRPGEEAYRHLEEVDHYVNLVAKIAENRFWSLRLQESEAAYRAIFDATTNGLLILDLEGAIVEANPAACRMHGYGYDELIGTSGRQLVVPDEHPSFEEFLAQTTSGAGYHVEGRNLRKDGSTFEVDARGAAFQYRGRPHILAIVQDITDKKRVLEHLIEQQKDESIVAVAGGVAHDFNNLLMGITGSLDLLRRELPPESAAERHTDRIGASAQALSGLTTQLLAIARGVHSEPRSLSLATVVEDNLALVRGMVGTRFTLDVDLAPDTGRVYGDAVQLGQLLLNLCQNAIEAMGRAGRLRIATGTVEREAMWSEDRTGPHAPGPYVYLRVQDDGPGMDARTRARIFEPYFSTKDDGSGLGLSAALGIVRRHEGAIQVASTVSEGTTIEVFLPRSEQKVLGTAPGGKAAPEKPRVLLVDDSEVVRDVAGEMLSSLGYLVVEATNGADAIELYSRGPRFDVVLLDVSMPGLSGVETQERLQALDASVRVVFASGHTERLVREGMEGEARIAAFLQKPFTMAKLEATLNRVFRDV